MKTIKIFSALLLAVMMLVLSACGEGKTKQTTPAQTNEKATTEKSTAQQQTEGLTEADKAFLETYLADYAAGKYDGEKFFQYESFEEFVADFRYKGLPYPADQVLDTTISDELLDDTLTYLFMEDAEYTDLTEGVVQKYDRVTIDFYGLIDGKEVDKTKGTDQALDIGSRTFIEGFEEGLVGKKMGEEVRLDLMFSHYYSDAEVAGKSVTFYVTIKGIERPTLPVLTVEMFEEYFGREYADLDEAREWCRAELQANAEQQRYELLSVYLQNGIMEQLNVVQYPDKELQFYMGQYINYYGQSKSEEMDWELYCTEMLGVTYEEFLSDMELAAKEYLKPHLMIYHVIRSEGLVCTSEQLGALIEGFYMTQNTEGYYKSLEELVLDYNKYYGADYFETQVLGLAAAEKIVEYAVEAAS